MDFEEWWTAEGEYQYGSLYGVAKAAWDAAFEEGYKFANKENEEYDKIGV